MYFTLNSLDKEIDISTQLKLLSQLIDSYAKNGLPYSVWISFEETESGILEDGFIKAARSVYEYVKKGNSIVREEGISPEVQVKSYLNRSIYTQILREIKINKGFQGDLETMLEDPNSDFSDEILSRKWLIEIFTLYVQGLEKEYFLLSIQDQDVSVIADKLGITKNRIYNLNSRLKKKKDKLKRIIDDLRIHQKQLSHIDIKCLAKKHGITISLLESTYKLFHYYCKE